MEIDLKEGRVLIVDDTPANIQLLGPILKEEGYKLVIATSGAKAIEIANKVIPDLILLDINMPEMDGYETCTRLKESNETKDIAIIFLSGNVEKEEIQKGYDLGAVDYLPKPFNHKELLTKVRTYVELSLARKKLDQL